MALKSSVSYFTGEVKENNFLTLTPAILPNLGPSVPQVASAA